MDFANIKSLGVTLLGANPSAPTAYSWGEDQFSYADLNDTFLNELNTLYNSDPRAAYKLVEQVITDSLPKKVLQQYDMFAETQTFAQGDKPVFKQRITEASKKRAKKFITKVGLAGRYEIFKLDGRNYEVQTNAIGGATQVSFEEVLDGRVQMSDLLQIAMEGIDEAIYKEIARALVSLVKLVPAANKYAANGFVEPTMDKLIAIADAYGKATIYCTFEFAAKMKPADAWASNEMKNDLWNRGYLTQYKGHNVVVLDQSFEDETNTKKVIDPGMVYIIPSGAEKPIKIAFEGSMHMREVESQDDWSRHIDFYQKVGVGAVSVNNGFCVYKDTSLAFDNTVNTAHGYQAG